MAVVTSPVWPFTINRGAGGGMSAPLVIGSRAAKARLQIASSQTPRVHQGNAGSAPAGRTARRATVGRHGERPNIGRPSRKWVLISGEIVAQQSGECKRNPPIRHNRQGSPCQPPSEGVIL